MTRRCARDGVLVRVARLRASVDHGGQRRNREGEDGDDRCSCRAEHWSIVLRCAPKPEIHLADRERRGRQRGTSEQYCV